MRARTGLLGVAVVLVGACGAEQSEPVAQPSAPTESSVVSTTTPTASADGTTTTRPIEESADSVTVPSTRATSTTAFTASTAPAPAPASTDGVAAESPPTTIPDMLTLRADGLDAADFGTDPADAIAVATVVFGSPDRDESTEYEPGDIYGAPGWINGDHGFSHRFGRRVCWSGALCLELGGDSSDGLRFVGWTYDGSHGAATAATVDGITIDSVLSDHSESIVWSHESACATTVHGSTTDGVGVVMHSLGDPFVTYDAAGTPMPGDPRLDEIVIVSLSAGERAYYIGDDC